MKTHGIFRFTFTLSFLFLFSANVFSQKVVLNPPEIPAEITKFVETHFPDTPIAIATLDNDDRNAEYEILLKDRTKLEFDHNFQLEKAESLNALPNSMFPQSVLDYVSANYPNSKITEWDIDRNDQEIELDNELELKFDKQGNFLRLDN
ncbi:MAG TPA: PepSY-like domain-containing protein [Cryomorphaceae bacterium]|nr:PepSY-like domain-containing protein [Cryomorphaceae bacterium]